MLNSFLITLPFTSGSNYLKSTPFKIVLILVSIPSFVNLFLTALELQIILSGKKEKMLSLSNLPLSRHLSCHTIGTFFIFAAIAPKRLDRGWFE